MSARKKILIVDFDELFILFITRELKWKFEILVNKTGSGLIGQIGKEKPDIVLLRADFIGNSTEFLLEEIKILYFDLPIILLSDDMSDEADLIFIAADFVVRKSSDLMELKKKIEIALKASNL